MLAFCTEAVGEESVRVRPVFFTHSLPAKLSKRRKRKEKVKDMAVHALSNAERFELAVAYVRDGGAKEQLAGRNPFSTDELLKFYGWYKQATQGDCSTPQPSAWSIEARAKWNSWNGMKGIRPEVCHARYLEQLVAKVPKDWEQWPQLATLKQELAAKRGGVGGVGGGSSGNGVEQGNGHGDADSDSSVGPAGAPDDQGNGIEGEDSMALFLMACAYIRYGGLTEQLGAGVAVGESWQLQLYALYRQATRGKCTDAPPSFLRAAAYAKWRAWQRLGNLSREQACRQYVACLASVAPNWRSWHGLAEIDSAASPPSLTSTPDTTAAVAGDASSAACAVARDSMQPERQGRALAGRPGVDEDRPGTDGIRSRRRLSWTNRAELGRVGAGGEHVDDARAGPRREGFGGGGREGGRMLLGGTHSGSARGLGLHGAGEKGEVGMHTAVMDVLATALRVQGVLLLVLCYCLLHRVRDGHCIHAHVRVCLSVCARVCVFVCVRARVYTCHVHACLLAYMHAYKRTPRGNTSYCLCLPTSRNRAHARKHSHSGTQTDRQTDRQTHTHTHKHRTKTSTAPCGHMRWGPTS